MTQVAWLLFVVLVLVLGSSALTVWLLVGRLDRLLYYQDHLLDRIQAPEVAAASSVQRLSPAREPGPKREHVLGRGGIRIRVPLKPDVDEGTKTS